MTIITKFWRTKAATVVTSIVAMMLVWGALAWPDWTSTKAAPYDADRAAWQWMASLTPEQRATLIAVSNQPAGAAPPAEPVAAEPPPVIVQHVTIVRHVPAGTAPDSMPAAGAPAAVSQAPTTSAPPQQVSAPVSAPVSVSVPRSSAPAPVSAPPPAPAPAPAPPPAPAPAPAPVTKTKAS